MRRIISGKTSAATITLLSCVSLVADMETIFRPYHPASGQRSDRSAGDRLRHRQKVREAIRNNIADIIAEESIIGKDNNRIVKVPIRGVKEYRFVYGENVPGVGQGGDGELQPGQTVGKGKEGAQGHQAGDQAGVDYYETEVSLDELVEVMFEDLELPDLDRKNLRQMEVERQFRHKGFRKKGIRVRLDKKRTARSRVKRKKASQRADVASLHGDRFPFHKDDLRYHHTVTETRRESNAVVLCIMDTSGFHGHDEKIFGPELLSFYSIDSFVHAMKTSKSSSSHTIPRRKR